jgi:beta-glucosidase
MNLYIKNEVNFDDKEVIEFYLYNLYDSVSRPNKQLKGFEKILLNPDRIKTLTLKNKEHFSLI